MLTTRSPPPLSLRLPWYDNLSWLHPPDFGMSDKAGLYGYTNDTDRAW
ncbi:MAG: hypothetical protein ABJA74_10555 [Lapillicoccus sp.]